MRKLNFLVFPWLLWGVALSASESQEDGVYVYHIFQDTSDCAEVVARLDQLPLRRTVILSVEEGAEFVLDRPDGEALLACVLENLRAASHIVKALMLQDVMFLQETDEAMRRAKLLGDFAAKHPGLLGGMLVDVEPHGTDQWISGEAEQRRVLIEALQQLLSQVRPQLQDLPLGLVIPWWYPVVTGELPKAVSRALFAAADEIYLMVYGDLDEPQEDSVTERLLVSLNAAGWFSVRRRVHVVLATHEYNSSAHLEANLREVRRLLGAWPYFAGTTIFHATSAFAFRQ